MRDIRLDRATRLLQPPGSFAKQLLARLHAAVPLREHGEQLEFRGGQFNRLAAPAHDVPWAVDQQITEAKGLLVLTGRLAAPRGRLTLDLARQAAARADQVTVTVDVAGGWRITGGGLNGRGMTAMTTRELDQNERLLTEIARK